MCLTSSPIKHWKKWNWDGDLIVHESIVPSCRPAVGSRKNYDVDVREFLVSEHNVVMRRTLETDIRQYIEEQNGDFAFFSSRRRGSFDYRANLIAEYVAEHISYDRSSKIDPWQFPEETLCLKKGDCEDRALLLASLFLVSGISAYNVRVCLGRMRLFFERPAERIDCDHVWVMYKSESGQWQVIEPARAANHNVAEAPPRMPKEAEYIPDFMFNDTHLWQIRRDMAYDGNAIQLGKDWSTLHPEFAGQVHKTILNEALKGTTCPPWALNALNRHFTGFGALTVDDVDWPGCYDPREHFDNGYIAEGWELVRERLARFNSDSIANLGDFHKAAHTIADFYAHTSYAHFAKRDATGSLVIYDPENPGNSLAESPTYAAGSSFDLASGTFSVNANLWKKDPAQAARQWNGKLISGRYGQRKDSHGMIEMTAFIPNQMESASDFFLRAALPHHNEIAVDGGTLSKEHILYGKADFLKQSQLRIDAATRHIRQAFQKHVNKL